MGIITRAKAMGLMRVLLYLIAIIGWFVSTYLIVRWVNRHSGSTPVAMKQHMQELWFEGATSAYPLDAKGELIAVDAIVWHNIMHFLRWEL